MTLSPRDRADYLLLIDSPTNRQCLEAFATESGVELCRQYPNIVTKASAELPELSTLLDALPAELVAIQVGLFLDGGRNAINTGDTLAVDGLLGE
jgi:hypothetical protein